MATSAFHSMDRTFNWATEEVAVFVPHYYNFICGPSQHTVASRTALAWLPAGNCGMPTFEKTSPAACLYFGQAFVVLLLGAANAFRLGSVP